MTTTFAELEQHVVQWARDRHIIPNSNPKTQLLKTMSELGELADALLKDDGDGVIDGIGDVLVTLILCVQLYDPGLDLQQCLAAAYQTIKDRKGTLTPEGIFVKETV
jgi:NTP pyrophosphatase (non-canonical NTP hydrolase)